MSVFFFAALNFIFPSFSFQFISVTIMRGWGRREKKTLLNQIQNFDRKVDAIEQTRAIYVSIHYHLIILTILHVVIERKLKTVSTDTHMHEKKRNLHGIWSRKRENETHVRKFLFASQFLLLARLNFLQFAYFCRGYQILLSVFE